MPIRVAPRRGVLPTLAAIRVRSIRIRVPPRRGTLPTPAINGPGAAVRAPPRRNAILALAFTLGQGISVHWLNITPCKHLGGPKAAAGTVRWARAARAGAPAQATFRPAVTGTGDLA